METVKGNNNSCDASLGLGSLICHGNDEIESDPGNSSEESRLLFVKPGKKKTQNVAVISSGGAANNKFDNKSERCFSFNSLDSQISKSERNPFGTPDSSSDRMLLNLGCDDYVPVTTGHEVTNPNQGHLNRYHGVRCGIKPYHNGDVTSENAAENGNSSDCVIDVDVRASYQQHELLNNSHSCSPYIGNSDFLTSSEKDNSSVESDVTLQANSHSNVELPGRDSPLTVINVDTNSDTYYSDREIPTSSSFLLDKSSGSVHVNTPNGSCLRGGSKAGCSVSTGPHVQFETPTPSQDDIFDKSSEIWESNQQNSRIGQNSDAEGHGILGNIRKRKRQRHVSGSSTVSVGSTASATSDGSEFQRKAPDGGWGWVIVASSFFVHCIADGVTMSFGVLFSEFLKYFKESKSLTSWVGSLFMAIPLLAGPLASIMTDHFGCRKVTIIGSVIACLGFFLSAFADSILVLLVTLGLITGLGLAVCYVAAIVIVAFYFEKKRSLATGIAVAGSGIGTFVFAPLIQYLIDNWGWRGTQIILAGIFLNMCVCGSVMRDLEWTKPRSERRGHSVQTNSRTGSMSHSSESLSDDDVSVENHQTRPPISELRRIVQSGDVTALLSPDESPTKSTVRSSSMLVLPTFLSRTQTLPLDILPCLNSRANAFEIVSQMYPHLLSSSLSEQLDWMPPMLSDTNLHQLSKVSEGKGTAKIELVVDAGKAVPAQAERPSQVTSDVVSLDLQHRPRPNLPASTRTAAMLGPEYRKASLVPPQPRFKFNEPSRSASVAVPSGAFLCPPTAALLGGRTGSTSGLPPYTGAPLRNMRINRQSMTYRGAMLNIHRYRLRASSCPDIYRNSMITIGRSSEKSYFHDLKTICKGCLDMHYCLDLGYVIFSLSNFILYLFYDTVYMYLVDYALEKGISEDRSAHLISIIGILNCIGMVGMGYIGDKEWYPLMFIYNMSMVMCGLAIIVMPFITQYWLLALLSALFGFFISANYALTSVILVELVSLDAFTKAYGVLLLIQGLANLFGPPVVGFMRDSTEDYVLPFFVSGVSIIGCGLMLFLIPCIRNFGRASTLNCDSTPTEGVTNLTGAQKKPSSGNENNRQIAI